MSFFDAPVAEKTNYGFTPQLQNYISVYRLKKQYPAVAGYYFRKTFDYFALKVSQQVSL